MSSKSANNVCANPGCSKVDDLKTCSRCHQVKYCSRDCQVSDWKAHKASGCQKKKKSAGGQPKKWQVVCQIDGKYAVISRVLNTFTSENMANSLIQIHNMKETSTDLKLYCWCGQSNITKPNVSVIYFPLKALKELEVVAGADGFVVSQPMAFERANMSEPELRLHLYCHRTKQGDNDVIELGIHEDKTVEGYDAMSGVMLRSLCFLLESVSKEKGYVGLIPAPMKDTSPGSAHVWTGVGESAPIGAMNRADLVGGKHLTRFDLITAKGTRAVMLNKMTSSNINVESVVSEEIAKSGQDAITEEVVAFVMITDRVGENEGRVETRDDFELAALRSNAHHNHFKTDPSMTIPLLMQTIASTSFATWPEDWKIDFLEWNPSKSQFSRE